MKLGNRYSTLREQVLKRVIIHAEVEVEAGVIKVKGKPGIGYDIDKKFIKTITAFEKEYK